MSSFFYPSRLHLLLSSGFDEIRFPWVPISPNKDERRRATLAQETPKISKFARVPAVRRIDSGAWFYVTYGSEPAVVRAPDDTEPKIALVPVRFPKALSEIMFLPLSDVVRNASYATSYPSAIVLPTLWRPPEHHPSIELVNTTKALLLSLQQGHVSLRGLQWRELEEIVAELLSSRGLDVHLTKRSRDGGRDIIARGELIPGEPTALAVEVKHKGVVGTPDIHRAWAANREFPLVMVATSGRFSAGVVQEKMKSDIYYRLLLKDGASLSQWISQYRRK